MTQLNLQLDLDRGFVQSITALERDLPNRVLRSINRVVLPPIERKFARLVAVYPPARTASSPKFIWSLDAEANLNARKWFFRNYPNGYTRTNAMREAWRTDIRLESDTVIIEAINENDGASYVYGSDEFRQVPGHETTGWLKIADVIVEIGADVENELEDLAFDLLDTL